MKFTKNMIVGLIMMVLTVFLFSCSMKPSEGDLMDIAESLLLKKESPLSKGYIPNGIAVLSIKKINGEGNDNSYRIGYEAKLKFLANGLYKNGFRLQSKCSWPDVCDRVRPGQVLSVGNYFNFKKTDNGWKCQANGKIY